MILVGEDPASLSYVKQKRKVSQLLGIETDFCHYSPTEVGTEILIAKIKKLSLDSKIHGILVQLPLPKNVCTPLIIKNIDPKKDVDGFTAYNLGKMFLSPEFESFVPCTPLGVIRLLEYYKIDIVGKEVVMVGASNIVGKPLAIMLLNRRATVTICHKDTKRLSDHTKRADILLVAVGKSCLIGKDMVKKGAVVIDIGINRNEKGKIVGDVDFAKVAPITSYITPVPGGCGPMTVACLMENVVKAAENISQ